MQVDESDGQPPVVLLPDGLIAVGEKPLHINLESRDETGSTALILATLGGF